MKRIAILMSIFAAVALGACTKPMVTAGAATEVAAFSRTYAASANDTYYAIRWALQEVGIPVASEDLKGGTITTKWMPATSDSHFLYVFERRDYGVTTTYFQLDLRLTSDGGRTTVKVASRVKTIASGIHSSGLIEEKVLAKADDFLRTNAPEITNLGASK
jgi:hypothetical protein